MIKCPHCKSLKSKVLDNRAANTTGIKRKRRCEDCLEPYYTLEKVIANPTSRKAKKATPAPLKRRKKRIPKPPKKKLYQLDINRMSDEELEKALFSGEYDIG